MISQILPYLVSATAMIRVSESGTYSELENQKLEAIKHEPLSGIYPEAFELSLEEDISMEYFLNMVGYACLKHKALLEVHSRASHPMPSAILSVVTSQESLQAVAIIRNKKIMFILPAPSP